MRLFILAVAFSLGLMSQTTLPVVRNGQTGNVVLNGNLTIGNTVIDPVAGITDGALPSSAFPGIIRANATIPLQSVPGPATAVGTVMNIQAFQVAQCVWTAGVATCTLRTGQSQLWVAGSWVTISGMSTSAYNGTFQTTSVTTTTVSYALATNPGTVTVSFGLVALEPDVQVKPLSPFGTAAIFIAGPSCVADGQDIGIPVIAITGSDGNIKNNGWFVGCDGHSVSIYFGGIRKAFYSGFVDSYTSEHTIGWGHNTSIDPSTSSDIDTLISKYSSGLVGIGTSSAANTKGGMALSSVLFTNPFSAANQLPTCGALASATITGATQAAPIVVTASNTFSSNDIVVVSGVLGNTAANGTWRISSVTGSGFTLVGSIGNAAYTSGGSAVSASALGMHILVSDATVATPGSAYTNGGTYTIGAQCIFNSAGSVYSWIID